VLSGRQPPAPFPANEHVHRQLGEQLATVATRWQRLIIRSEYESSDVRNGHVIADRQLVAHLVAGPGSLSLVALEANVDRVQLLVAFDQRAVGAPPDHIARELAIQQICVSLIVPGLETGGELCDRSSCLRVLDGHIWTVVVVIWAFCHRDVTVRTQAEGVADRVGVHDEDAVWFLNRITQGDGSEGGGVATGRVKVGHGEIQMQLLG
jgi:hypothetical protein